MIWMCRVCLIAVLALTFSAGLLADEPAPEALTWEERIEDARTRRSERWVERVEVFRADNPSCERGAIVFVGDSITQGFPIDVAFPDGNVINRGIGGDVVDGLRERLDLSVEDLAPSAVYVMIGINNLWWAGPEDNAPLFEDYEALFRDLRSAAPDAEIIIQSLLPLGEAMESLNPRVIEINAALQEMAAEFGFDYLDVHSIMTDDEGRLRADYTVDGVHLTSGAYEAWIELLFSEQMAIGALINLNAALAGLHCPTLAIDQRDPLPEGQYPGNRGPDELVIYTPDYIFDSTGTNQWGVEAIVENGVVIDCTTEGDATIPMNGMVISGHGSAAQWIARNLSVGTSVSADDGIVRYTTRDNGEMTLDERISAARRACLDLLISLEGTEGTANFRRDGREMLGDLIRLARSDLASDETMVRVLERRVSGLAELARQHLSVPSPPREFRGLWVATVSNIDWPSEPGLTTQQMQAELIAIMDRAEALNLNAVVFQVRTGCDALFDSPVEPWSYYLNGVEGQVPDPYFDPLEMAIAEAHSRGLELHAWLNPFRARRGIYEHSEDHISQTQPDLVYDYSEDFEWLDPGREEAQNLSFGVIMDVVRRYDVDAIHFDDYFYPYPIEGIEFPDGETFAAYQAGGGEMSLLDWRRDNVNRFIVRVRDGMREIKPWVRFGISPFGVWRPDHPEGIIASDMYDGIACDSRLWIREGWVDYIAPQLYWAIESPGQPFEPLLDWWIDQNPMERHVWAGICPMRISETERGERQWAASEIIDQIAIERTKPGSTGVILYHDRPLAENRDGIFDALADGPYTHEALVPASPWLDEAPPAPPEVAASQSAPGAMRTIHWMPSDGVNPARWVVHMEIDDEWYHDIVLGSERNRPLPFGTQRAAVSAVNSIGVESERVVMGFGAIR